MAKQTPFPVKYFKVQGSSLSEKKRVAVVREAMSGRFVLECNKAPKKAIKGASATKVAKKAKGGLSKGLDLKDTATGSGRVSFSFAQRPIVTAAERSKKRA